MIRLLRVNKNLSSEDTALDTAWGQRQALVGRYFRHLLFILGALGVRPPLASFASSGLLTTQILRGAPFELFLSADHRTVSRLMAAGKTQQDPIALASGQLSLVTLKKASPLQNENPTLASIEKAMFDKNSINIAIPNPRHAPYGIAAQQALANADLWPIPRGALLNAENASQALQYALNGAASYAIVPTTLVVNIPFDLTVPAIDPDTHDPVIHHLAVLTPAGRGAHELKDWLRTPKARDIMTQFGLTTSMP